MILYSVIMLITGYFGEVVLPDSSFLGAISGAVFLIVLRNWLGEASKLAAAAGGVSKGTQKFYVGSF
jgi:hypothetical protein